MRRDCDFNPVMQKMFQRPTFPPFHMKISPKLYSMLQVNIIIGIIIGIDNRFIICISQLMRVYIA